MISLIKAHVCDLARDGLVRGRRHLDLPGANVITGSPERPFRCRLRCFVIQTRRLKPGYPKKESCMRLVRCLRALLVCAIFTALGLSQTDTGSIGGYVKDPSGGTIPKAKVVLKNEGTGEAHNITTNDAGYYIVTNLPPGFYTMSAEAAGFKRFESKNNKLDPNSSLSL